MNTGYLGLYYHFSAAKQSQTVFAWMFKPKRRGGLQAASAPSSCCSSTASAHPASHSPTAACPDSGMMVNESQVAKAIIAQLVCFPPFPEAALSTVQPCSSDEGERANTGSDNSAAGLNPPTHEPTLLKTGKFLMSHKEKGKLKKLTNTALKNTAFGNNGVAAEMIWHGFVQDCFCFFFSLTSLVLFCFFNYRHSTGNV